MGLPFQLGVGGGNRQQTNQQKDYQVVINAKVKIKQGEGTEWLEAHLDGVVREHHSEVTLRLRPKLKQNQSCKDWTQKLSDKGNGPEKALRWE